MSRTIEARVERDLTDEELNAVSGGTIRQPSNSTILINKPVFRPLTHNQEA